MAHMEHYWAKTLGALHFMTSYIILIVTTEWDKPQIYHTPLFTNAVNASFSVS
jgi:hypothetical protein